jgi:hypothetical protein
MTLFYSFIIAISIGIAVEVILQYGVYEIVRLIIRLALFAFLLITL